MPQYYRTRQWRHPEGYKYLAVWTNAVLLRFLIRKFTETLPHSEYRRQTQLDDSGRSAVSNIEEGYKRPTTKEYLDFIGFGQGSLEEIKGLIKQAYQDGFLKSKPGSVLADLGIKLEEVKGLLKDSKGEVPLEVLYPPLASLKASDLTFEMFLELINKTDWLFRQTVTSLEKKMAEEIPLSPREKWLKARAERQLEEDRKFDRELRESLRKEGMIFTIEGVMNKEEAERRGLKEIDLP
jgi:four helix bundle protein